MGVVLIPLSAVLFVFIMFSYFLKKNVKDGIVIELGYIYIFFVVIYTLAPGLGILYAINNPDEELGMLMESLDFDPTNLGFHLWRHFIFILSFSLAYLLFRGKNKLTNQFKLPRKQLTVGFLMVSILLIILFLNVMSSPISRYYDHYNR